MGVESPIVSSLQRAVQSDEYAAVLHLGDFAYDLESEGGLVSYHSSIEINASCVSSDLP